ncbi:MAG: FAD-dependent thymidylate synthase [Zhaonellaceae bacterium]|jgi:thymidylate synthase (FAD)|nr:FAD-dependent thymidylate synthase [Clostridia bacterium]
MRVTLINHTPEPEKVVAAAAKLCYSSSGIDDLLEKLDTQNIAHFLQKLINMGHESPFEHVTFTFGIEGVSRNLTHQLVRHRIASYSQKSQRYVSENNFSYIIPPSIAKNKDAFNLYQQKMKELQETYDELAKIVPKEDARYILPGACETKIIATFNARSLFNFFAHRCCRRAQWEIRSLANEMLSLVKDVAPVLFSKAGPTCVTEGVCYEGEMSCGRVKHVVVR